MATELVIPYHPVQDDLFHHPARYKIIHKGRRFGLTHGMAHYVIEHALTHGRPILWVDTSYPNIERYVDRYFKPMLKKLPARHWHWNRSRYEMRIGKAVIDFRSAEKPDNIEGFGYALIVINEAGIVLKNARIWEESVRPMVIDYKAACVIGGTPKGMRLKKTSKLHPFYELSLRARDPERTDWADFGFSTYENSLLDVEEIRELERDTAPALRAQEIHGKFVDHAGQEVFHREWFARYDVDRPDPARLKFLSFDTAMKEKESNDWSVGTAWNVTGPKRDLGPHLQCTEMLRGRFEFPELQRQVRAMIARHRPNFVLIEDKSSGTSLIQTIRDEGVKIIAVTPEGDKMFRGHRVTPYFERGQIEFPQGAGCDWVDEIENEMVDFPDGEFDDIYDSVCQAVWGARKYLDAKKRGVGTGLPSKRHTGEARGRRSEITAGY